MQKTVIIALAVIGTLTAGFFLLKNHKSQDAAPVSDVENIYNQWKVDYKINVGASENSYRLGVFSENYGKIQHHNRLLGRTYNKGLNAFTHLTPEEFSATHLGLKQKVGAHATRKNYQNLSAASLPTQVDWTPKLNAVKNQGQCGSCWAFSTVGALEGLHSVKFGNLYNLAEQELVDCSGSFGNEGCSGGLMDNGFKYVMSVGGLASEADYPYTAADGDCKSGLTRQGKISNFADVEVNSPDALKAAIAQQPVSVAIEADTDIFQSYSSGVITSADCGTQLDHGVVAVGYDTTGRNPYYIVRNSWGDSWGLKGYVNIGIAADAGICGIQQAASYPTA